MRIFLASLLKSNLPSPQLGLLYCVFCAVWRIASIRPRGRGPIKGAPMPLSFKPKLDKIVELLLYLAHRRPGADKYQAVKFFYLADREHLSRFGRPITFDTYFAFPHGPAPSKTMDLIEKDKWVMRSAKIDDLPFETIIGPAPNGAPTIFIGKPKRNVNLDLFSKSDLAVFDEIIDKYGNASFDELWNLTHGHEAYKTAWNTRREGQRAPMFYEEMIEDKQRRAALLDDLEPVAAHMR